MPVQLVIYNNLRIKRKENTENSAPGVAASENMMQFDLERAMSYKERILTAAEKTGIDPAIIAAMTSR